MPIALVTLRLSELPDSSLAHSPWEDRSSGGQWPSPFTRGPLGRTVVAKILLRKVVRDDRRVGGS